MQHRSVSEKRSLIVFGHYHEGEQKFEYFITGVSTALVAWVGQTLQPQKFGWNAYTLEVVSVALVVASIIVGFKRIEFGSWLSFLNATHLHLGEMRGTLATANPQGFINVLSGEAMTPKRIQEQITQINKDLPEAEAQIKTVQSKILKYYRWRNWLLLCGFLGLFVAKILQPYLR